MPDADMPDRIHVVSDAPPYCNAVVELLCRINPLWRHPEEISGDDSNNVEGKWSPLENFLGINIDSSEMEPTIRSEVERRENDGSLANWLTGIPNSLFYPAVSDMGCTEADYAPTKEEVAKLFLKHFGYFDETDRQPPQGIFTASEIIKEKAQELAECSKEDLSTITGIGANFGQAVESVLQLMALFYGQYLRPDIFKEYLQRQTEFLENEEELKKWWNSISTKLGVKGFLLDHKTQMGYLVQILKELEVLISSSPDLLGSFRSKFKRESIFPPFDKTKLLPRIGSSTYAGEFLIQLDEIRELRNSIQHTNKPLLEHTVKQDPLKMFELVQELADRCDFFMEVCKSHRLFPDIILVIAIKQNIRRRWTVDAITERNDTISFSITKEMLDIFVPDCEIACWPPLTRSIMPSVALLRRWRE
jgi:hypothetical protein